MGVHLLYSHKDCYTVNICIFCIQTVTNILWISAYLHLLNLNIRRLYIIDICCSCIQTDEDCCCRYMHLLYSNRRRLLYCVYLLLLYSNRQRLLYCVYLLLLYSNRQSLLYCGYLHLVYSNKDCYTVDICISSIQTETVILWISASSHIIRDCYIVDICISCSQTKTVILWISSYIALKQPDCYTVDICICCIQTDRDCYTVVSASHIFVYCYAGFSVSCRSSFNTV